MYPLQFTKCTHSCSITKYSEAVLKVRGRKVLAYLLDAPYLAKQSVDTRCLYAQSTKYTSPSRYLCR